MIRVEGPRFVDECGRSLILRGVNLDSKVPSVPDGATCSAAEYLEDRDVSFVGRPFPLDEADEHYERLKSWGLTFLRFLVPWEAIEHRGPGLYDEEYLDYLHAVVRKAGDHGINLFVDARQDMWSRFSGGDGAPGWTFDAVGIDFRKIEETGAAIVVKTHRGPVPRQVWATNQYKFAAATMYTLFFGGNDFAPETLVEGEPVQEFLQSRRIAAYQEVARRLKGLPNVVGYDCMNEPLAGYIGMEDLRKKRYRFKNGETPSPFEGMALASGFPRKVAVYRTFPPVRTGSRLLNPEGVRLWKDGRECVWKAHGVWGLDATGEPVLKRPDYFARSGGRRVSFQQDYLRPYANRFIEGIREVDPGATLFFTPSVSDNDYPTWGEGDAGNVVFKPHWFDVVNWFLKLYVPGITPLVGVDAVSEKPVVGLPSHVRKNFASQFERLKSMGLERMGGVPTLIGEVGICYDMNRRKAYRTGDFSLQAKVFDRIIDAMDASCLNYAIWTYNARNTNERGDGWNEEDFSIYSLSQRSDPDSLDSGGRALEAVVRPYPTAVAGEPLSFAFDMTSRTFDFSFQHDDAVDAPTEIFVPRYQYPDGCDVTVSDGSFEMNEAKQVLVYRHDTRTPTHTIKIGVRS